VPERGKSSTNKKGGEDRNLRGSSQKKGKNLRRGGRRIVETATGQAEPDILTARGKAGRPFGYIS